MIDLLKMSDIPLATFRTFIDDIINEIKVEHNDIKFSHRVNLKKENRGIVYSNVKASYEENGIIKTSGIVIYLLVNGHPKKISDMKYNVLIINDSICNVLYYANDKTDPLISARPYIVSIIETCINHIKNDNTDNKEINL